MLSRTASNLYWLARCIERAENVARLLEVADRMAILPRQGADDQNEWHSVLVASGNADAFYGKHEEATRETVIEHLAMDAENPSSIRSCLATARTNARAVRTALTADMWGTLNDAWLDLVGSKRSLVNRGELSTFLDWVKDRSSLLIGEAVSGMLRSEAYYFLRLGTHIERADCTARILDVKYHILLPETQAVGGGADYYQWTALLRSFSASRSYYWTYKDTIKPWLIAEFLILREEMPRSLVWSHRQIDELLGLLAGMHGYRAECHRLAGQNYSRLRYATIDDVFQGGLHEFLTDFIARNNRLSDEIAACYLN